MEIITEITTDNLLNLLKTDYKNNPNISNFINNLDYNLFEKIINNLINYGYDIINIIDLIHIGELDIIRESELNNISYLKKFKIDTDLYLIICYV